jgi:hypothetical protein
LLLEHIYAFHARAVNQEIPWHVLSENCPKTGCKTVRNGTTGSDVEIAVLELLGEPELCESIWWFQK